MRYEFCSEEEFTQRIYDHLTEDLARKEGMTVEEVRRLVPLASLRLNDGLSASE